MAIRMMVSADHANDPDVEIVSNYFGHEATRVIHGYDCPHTNETDMSGAVSPECPTHTNDNGTFCHCHVCGPLYMQTTHRGFVVALCERNGYSDSDFVAVVWNPETQSPFEVEYGTTRFWTYPNSATIDAPPEIIDAYVQFTERARAQAREAYRQQKEREVGMGKLVRVCKGRKIPIGTVGTVVWYGAHKFKRYEMRVGIRIASGERLFTDKSNLEVVIGEA